MKRIAPFSALGLAVCLVASLGFSPKEKTDAEKLTIRVTSSGSPVQVRTAFESNTGFSMSLEEGATPLTLTIKADQFSGLITPKQDAPITVKASSGGLTATRSGSSGPVRVTRNGADFHVSGVEEQTQN